MRRLVLVVASFTVLMLLAAMVEGQDTLYIAGRVTHVTPWEMLVEVDDGPVVMVDVTRIPQGELRELRQHDYVVVTGFIRRPSHKLFATEVRRTTPWLPNAPRWAPQGP